MNQIRCYTELERITDFRKRYDYLRMQAAVGQQTFGFDRYLNQRFYTSVQWRHLRNQVIARDRGCDLGIEGHEIFDRVIIHHMNPMTIEDIQHGNESILDPEFLITASSWTHNAIHFGDEKLLVVPFRERHPGDTKLW